MKRFLLIAAVAALSTMTAPAQSEAELRAAEQEWADAVSKMDYARIDKVHSDDLIYTHSNGVVDNKTQFADALKKGVRKYESVKIEEMTVRPYGNTAAVAAKVTMVITAGGQTAPRSMRYLRFWAKKQGRWQLVGHQSVSLPK